MPEYDWSTLSGLAADFRHRPNCNPPHRRRVRHIRRLQDRGFDYLRLSEGIALEEKNQVTDLLARADYLGDKLFLPKGDRTLDAEKKAGTLAILSRSSCRWFDSSIQFSFRNGCQTLKGCIVTFGTLPYSIVTPFF